MATVQGDGGLGRNIAAIFDDGEMFAGMGAHPLKLVSLSEDRSAITFEFDGAPAVSFGVEGDCCSSSWIEHLDVPPDVIGEVIISVEDSDGVPWDGHDCKGGCGHDYLQVYNTRFKTAKGDIVLEYRNDSNGYYGGYLVRRGE